MTREKWVVDGRDHATLREAEEFAKAMLDQWGRVIIWHCIAVCEYHSTPVRVDLTEPKPPEPDADSMGGA